MLRPPTAPLQDVSTSSQVAPLWGLLSLITWLKGVCQSLRCTGTYSLYHQFVGIIFFFSALRCLNSIHSGHTKIMLFLITNSWFPWPGPSSWSAQFIWESAWRGLLLKKLHRADALPILPFTKAPTVCRAWRGHEGSSTAPLSRREQPFSVSHQTGARRRDTSLGELVAKKLGHATPCWDPCCGHFKERHKDTESNLHKVTQGVAAPAGIKELGDFCSLQHT